MNTSGSSNQVQLLVNGTHYGGWKSVRISAGVDRQARDFELQITDSWPGQTEVPRRIQAGEACQVLIGKDLVMTGYVDSTPISYDGQSYSVSVKGRSKTADLVDCSPVLANELIKPIKADAARSARAVPPPVQSARQWRKQKLETIAAALAAPYGVRVIAQTPTGAVIPEHQVQIGETVFESIDRMMRLRHVLSSDNEAGDLVFIELGGAGRADSAIETGVNVLAGSAELDYKGVYSDYIVTGQSAGSEEEPGSAASARATDAQVRRRRLLLISQSGQADASACHNRAQYESARRAASALHANYTLSGWRQASGALWQPNLLVQVRDKVMGVHTEMLISECSWLMDEQGLRTEVAVGPLKSYTTLGE